MRKTYLAKRNALLSPAGFSAGAIALALVIAFAVLRMLVPDAFLTLAAPLSRTGDAATAGVHGFLASFSDASTLSAENARLAEENRVLAAQNRALSDRLANLTPQITTAESKAPGMRAEVLARPPVSAYDALVLSAGSVDGAEEGMEAFSESGVPLGVVSSVSKYFSRVTLFSAPRESLSVLVGSKNTALTLSGAGAGAFAAEAPRVADIREGDAVYAPGAASLPLGVVKRIDGAPSSPTVTLRIAPVINPFSLSFVVLRDSGGALAGTLTCATSTP